MPVVINEFEVVAEPPPQSAAPGARAEQSSEPTSAMPDIDRVLQRAKERARRVRAH